MSKTVVDRINEENAKKYGEMQICCGLFKAYCRCETKLPFQKEYWFGPTNGPAPEIEVLEPCHVDAEVYNWFQQKLIEASKISNKPIPNIKATTLGLELPTLDIKTGRLKWSIWQREFWNGLKFWKKN